jgi:hypothetical protein
VSAPAPEPAPAEIASVCVLGPPRTGTSLTTRILSLAGMYLGPEDGLVRPRRMNPAGFWERQALTRLDARLLKKLGGTWRYPPRPPAGWERAESLAAERAEARSLLTEAFGGHSPWGWKDPLACLTLPFWQQLVPGMRYAICVRDPRDATASGRAALARLSPPLDDDEAVGLWARYLASAIVHTTGRPRTFVAYEDYFGEWRRPIDCLLDLLGVDEHRRDGALPMIIETIDAGLWHNRSSPRSDGDDLPSDAAALYDAVRALIDGQAGHGPTSELERTVEAEARRVLGDGG